MSDADQHQGMLYFLLGGASCFLLSLSLLRFPGSRARLPVSRRRLSEDRSPRPSGPGRGLKREML
jgi:hypothetical protein